jgi:hypothetical protein
MKLSGAGFQATVSFLFVGFQPVGLRLGMALGRLVQKQQARDPLWGIKRWPPVIDCPQPYWPLIFAKLTI